jgi:hypothetical protein
MREADLVGQDILVGLTYHDKVRDMRHNDQFHGRILELRDGNYLIKRFDRGKEVWIPRDPEAIRPAPAGAFRLAVSDQIIDDPTWLTSWLYDVLEDEEGNSYYEVEPNYAPIGPHSRAEDEWDFTYRYDEEAIRRKHALFSADYLGKLILLGVSHFEYDQCVRHEQIVGTIGRANLKEGVVVEDESGKDLFKLPPDLTMIEKGQAAEYRLRSNGRIVNNPAYVASIRLNIEP